MKAGATRVAMNPVSGSERSPEGYFPAAGDLVTTLNDTPIMGGGTLLAGELLRVAGVWTSQGREKVVLLTLADPESGVKLVSGLRSDRVRAATETGNSSP